MEERENGECPFVDRSFTPAPASHNEPVEYACENGAVYVFYRHDDGLGEGYNCQFCSLVGRVRDVFMCLNELEWGRCFHYRNGAK